jgi:hypothetical protein
MTAVRFFTDEDVYGSVAGALRRPGYDAGILSEFPRSRRCHAAWQVARLIQQLFLATLF